MGSLRTVIVIKPNSHEEEHANSTQNEAQTSRFRTNLCLTCIKLQQTPVFKQQERGALKYWILLQKSQQCIFAVFFVQCHACSINAVTGLTCDFLAPLAL